MGVYFRLMNEVVTRRSFLDRRACVESTLRLKFVKDQEVIYIYTLIFIRRTADNSRIHGKLISGDQEATKDH